MSTKLYVGNLAFQTTSQELQDLFATAGTVESASVVEDRDTGRSRGFAFVEMSTKEEATSAIDQCCRCLILTDPTNSSKRLRKSTCDFTGLFAGIGTTTPT